jgi:hypothetical protein
MAAMRRLPLVPALGASLVLACGGDGSEPVPQSLGGWTPGTVLPSEPETGVRGLLDLRGIIHAHSVYSHDACDGEPRENETGAINKECFDDLRRGLCVTRPDFLMLSDHSTTFADTEYPDVLQYRPNRGDRLVERGGSPVASFAVCPDGVAATLVMAGTESGTMPVGLERHVAEDPDERDAIYDEVSVAAVQTFREAGAVALLQHTEEWSVAEILDLGVDGFEMYNLHANMFANVGGAISLIKNLSTPELLPHPDLVLLPILSEDDRYLERWGRVLAAGAHRVTTMATDCHRNSFPQELPDGERIDSYRRMLGWLSNHLLVPAEPDGSWDDRHVKEALTAARLYGVFEVLGYAEGFDFRAERGGDVFEIGAELPFDPVVTLLVEPPRVRALSPEAAQPLITLRLLRATEDGWQEVAQGGAEPLALQPTEPGAYRAEVRMRPRHLAPYLSSYADLGEHEFVWIYANAIYLTEPAP